MLHVYIWDKCEGFFNVQIIYWSFDLIKVVRWYWDGSGRRKTPYWVDHCGKARNQKEGRNLLGAWQRKSGSHVSGACSWPPSCFCASSCSCFSLFFSSWSVLVWWKGWWRECSWGRRFGSVVEGWWLLEKGFGGGGSLVGWSSVRKKKEKKKKKKKVCRRGERVLLCTCTLGLEWGWPWWEWRVEKNEGIWCIICEERKRRGNYGSESGEIEDEREFQWVVETFETIKGEKKERGEDRFMNKS